MGVHSDRLIAPLGSYSLNGPVGRSGNLWGIGVWSQHLAAVAFLQNQSNICQNWTQGFIKWVSRWPGVGQKKSGVCVGTGGRGGGWRERERERADSLVHTEIETLHQRLVNTQCYSLAPVHHSVGVGGWGGVTCGHAHNNHQYVHYDSHYHTAKHILKQEAEGDF